MTNKEIVQKLFDRCLPCVMSLTADQENQIIRDLEVIDILKKLDWLVFINVDKNDFNYYIDLNKSTKLTNEETVKIQEWLNEKERLKEKDEWGQYE